MKKLHGVIGSIIGLGIVAFSGWNNYTTHQIDQFVDKYNEYYTIAQGLEGSIRDDGSYDDTIVAKLETIADEMINKYCGKLKKSESKDMCKRAFTSEKNMFVAIQSKDKKNIQKYLTEMMTNSTAFETQLKDVEKILMN